MSRRLPTWLSTPILFIALALVIIAVAAVSPIVLPFAIYYDRRERRRKRHAAETTTCVDCVQILGRPSVALSDKQYSEFLAELSRKYPGSRFLLAPRRVHAICTNCGASYRYWPNQRRFIREHTEDDSGEPPP